MKIFYTQVCAILLLSLLSACSSFSESDYTQESPTYQSPDILPQYSKDGFACPTVGIIEDLRSITIFKNNENPTNKTIAGYAKLEDFSGSCAYENGYVEINMNVLFSAKSGTKTVSDRVKERTIAFPYFVAIADQQGNILRKEVFAVAMRFMENRDTSTQADSIRPRIEINNPQMGQQYQVLIGFQLTKEQLAFNRGG